MSNYIRMVFQRPTTTMKVCDDKWRFAPVNRWGWLQRIAWGFLQRTNALTNAIEETVSYKEIIIDKEKVSETIFAAMHEMNCAYVRPSRVFMGPDNFKEVAFEMQHAVNFTTQFGHSREIFDLPVTIIPWMRGVVVVPEE